MKLEEWLEMEDLDPKNNYKHWSDDLNFCQARKEINWAKDDGCIKWESL